MWDAINQFVAEGIRGGFGTLILFIVLLSLCYRTIGVKIAEAGNNRPAQLTLWAIGSALFTHTISFFGIAYFDQIVVFWYFMLAMISTMSTMSISEIYPVVNGVAHVKMKRGENAAWISP
jgi:CDP-diglyceride synthetase